jgi:RecB family exonuclease
LADEHTTADAPAADEMLLFYQLVSRPSKRLTLSYPALDDRAQTLLPSPYLSDIERLFADSASLRRSTPSLSPVPGAGAVFGARAWRLRATHEALFETHGTQLFAGLNQSPSRAVGRSIMAGLEAVHCRSRGRTFGRYEGILESAAARARLGQRFGENHLWSASQLESYAACPFRFFLEHILACEPAEDLVLETNYLRRGTLLHDTIAEFHMLRQDAAHLNREEFHAAFADVLRRRADIVQQAGMEQALVEIERRQVDRWSIPYFEQYARYRNRSADLDEPMTPTYFELRFGPARPSGPGEIEDAASTNEPLELVLDGETIRITGRIDRIDTGKLAGQTVFNVVDFKTTRPNKLKPATVENVEQGKQLQVPLYVMAAQMVLQAQGAVPLEADYWAIRGKGFGGKKEGPLQVHTRTGTGLEPTGDWPTIEQSVKAKLVHIVQGVRRGEFPVDSLDDGCTSTCEFRTVCRLAQVRSLNKQRALT